MGVKQKRDKDGLTDLERRFVVHYIKDFNATQAYIRASTRKVTNGTASTNSSCLLQRPEIQKLVRAELDARMEKAGLGVEETLNKLRQTLMFDPRKMFHEDGSMKRLHEIDDDTAAAVAAFDNGVSGVKVKFVDRLSAIEKAMKYHGLFEKDNNQTAAAMAKLAEGISIKLVPPSHG